VSMMRASVMSIFISRRTLGMNWIHLKIENRSLSTGL
jgi:hypothetical protein